MTKFNIVISAFFGVVMVLSLLEVGSDFSGYSDTTAYLIKMGFAIFGAFSGVGIFMVMVKKAIPKEYEGAIDKLDKD